MADRMDSSKALRLKSITPKSLPQRTSKISKPSVDTTDNDFLAETSSRPGTSRANSNPRISSTQSEQEALHARVSTMTSTPKAKSSDTPKAAGQTFQELQESQFPPPKGKKHALMGKKDFNAIPNVRNIESAVKRGMKLYRKIPREQSSLSQSLISEQRLEQVTSADAQRLTMMADYFAEKCEDYRQMIEKRIDYGRRKREANAAQGIEEKTALGPFRMSKKFYNMMGATMNQFLIAYRKLTRIGCGPIMIRNYDHIVYDPEISEGLERYEVQFVHLVCKPYQCWMNLFQIDETAAQDLSTVALLILEHLNKVGRYHQPFPKWLVDLRRWEQSIQMQYLSKPVHIFEVIDNIKNGNYWARYNQYLREENDDVYIAKWSDGTDWFPHKTTVVYWYYSQSEVDHWMDINEYNDGKHNNKGKKKKKKESNVADNRRKRSKARGSMHDIDADDIEAADDKEDFMMKYQQGNEADNEDDDDADQASEEEEIAAGAGFGVAGGLEFLDLITVTDSEPEDEYSSSASDESIPVNKYIYRCPQALKEEFNGWTAYHQSFVGFISRDLLEIDECEREIARNPSEDHWRRRHLHLGNGYDLPVCQYRLITKKLNLEHEVRENLRMLAILKKNRISASAPLTQTKYMPEWVKFKAQTHFNKLYGQIRKQQEEFTPQKKQLLESLKVEIQTREAFNGNIGSCIQDKKSSLQDNLSKLKMLHDRQVSLLDYIVTAKHRVANAKLKVAYARQQVEILENDVKDLREMTPREKQFAQRNKRYYEAVSIHKLCKQYHSLKRNNYDPNQIYLSQYREKIKRLLKNVALYNLWYWSVKQRYKTHKKFEVIQTAYDLINPTKDWMADDPTITEMLLSNEKLFKPINAYDPHKIRKEHVLFQLTQPEDQDTDKEEEEEEDEKEADKTMRSKKRKKRRKIDDIELGPAAQIERDRIEFQKIFYEKKRATVKYAALNMSNPSEQQHIFEQKRHAVTNVMDKFRSDDRQLQQILRKRKNAARPSISSRRGTNKNRRVSEVDIPELYEDENNALRPQSTKAEVKDVLDRQLAGGQRLDDDDDDRDFMDDEDDAQHYEEDEYEEDDDEYYDDEDEDEDDEDDYDDDESRSETGDEEDIQTGDEYEEDVQTDEEFTDHELPNEKSYVFRPGDAGYDNANPCKYAKPTVHQTYDKRDSINTVDSHFLEHDQDIGSESESESELESESAYDEYSQGGTYINPQIGITGSQASFVSKAGGVSMSKIAGITGASMSEIHGGHMMDHDIIAPDDDYDTATDDEDDDGQSSDYDTGTGDDTDD